MEQEDLTDSKKERTHPGWMHYLTSRTAIFWMAGITLLLILEAGFLYWKNIELSRRIDRLQMFLPEASPTLPAPPRLPD